MPSKSSKNKFFSFRGSPFIEWVIEGRKPLLILLGLFMLFWLVFDLTPFGGNIRFYAKWVECDRRPLVTSSWAGVAWYEEDVLFQPMLRGYKWYCTPLEAERAGYSANENYYDFPHLEAAGELKKN